MKQHKNTVQTIQNTVHTNIHITKIPTQLSKHPHITKHPHIHTPTHYKTPTHNHTLQNKLKQSQYKIHTKWNSHNTIKYPLYKDTIKVHGTFVPKNFTVTSLHFKTKSLHINHVSSLYVYITTLHLFTLNLPFDSLACNYILNPLSERV